MQKISLNIKFDDESQETAEVYVEGKILDTSTQFLFDTGCAETSVPFNDITSGLKVISSRESSGAVGRASYDSVLMEKIQFGPIVKNNVQVSRAAPGGLDRNLLGMNILKDYCLHVKFSDMNFEILNEIGYDQKDANPLLIDQGNIPYVDVHWNEVVAKAVWDTGAGITLVDKSFLEKNPLMFKSAGSTSGTDSTGATVETPLYEMKEVIICGYVFKPHKVVVLDLSHVNSKIEIQMDFILGFSTIKQAHWIFDFPKKLWKISKMIS